MSENIYSIYRATNKINGKSYIGFDSKWPKRKYEHEHDSLNSNCDFYFHKAIRKYGKENFYWELLYQSKDKEHCLKTMEGYFIFKFKTYVGYKNCNGYNMSKGGEGAIGRTPWNKGKKCEQISLSLKGKSFPKPTLRGKPSWNKGIIASEETKKKQSLAKIGKPVWNKGLTKEIDSRIQKGIIPWNKGLTKQDPRVNKIYKLRSGNT